MGGQPQFYLEQDFPSHPKVVTAGGDAGWLYVCAMGWATKHLTGRIPKTMVPQLSDRRSPMRLAAKLCAVGLWHDRGDHFEIHDFETRNKKMLAARRKGKHAAEVRWQNARDDAPSNAPSNAPSIGQALLDGCTSNASRAGEPRNQGTKEPRSVLLTSPPPLTVVRSNHEAAEFLREVVEAVATRQLEAAKKRKGVASESGWLVIARRNIEVQHRDAILQAHAFGQTASEVADRIEPPPSEPVRDPNEPFTDEEGRTFLPGTGWV